MKMLLVVVSMMVSMNAVACDDALHIHTLELEALLAEAALLIK